MPVSPGIYVREFDFSQYVPKLGLTSLALLGTASKGPLNTPTLIRNESELVRTFGKPLTDDFGLQSAVQYLRQGDRLLYTRVASGAATASYPAPGFINGTAPTVATGTISLSAQPSDADTVVVYGAIPTVYLTQDTAGTAGNTTITIGGASAANVVVTAKDSTVIATPVAFSGGTASSAAAATIRFIGTVAATTTVTLNDGTTSVTFTAVASGATALQFNIGATDYATMTNLIAAINNNAFGITATDQVVRTTFEFDSNGAVGTSANNGTGTATVSNTAVVIGSTSAVTMANLVAAIAGSALPVTVTNTTTGATPSLALRHTLAGAAYNATITKAGSGAANITLVGMSGAVNATSGASNTAITFAAANPGTWGNTVKVAITSPTTMLAPTTTDAAQDPVSGRFDISVYSVADDGVTLVLSERFVNMSLWSASSRYVTSALSYGIKGEVSPSAYIRSTVTNGASSLVTGTYTLGTGTGTVGTNGGGSYTSVPTATAGGFVSGTAAVLAPVVVGGRVVSVAVTSGGTSAAYPASISNGTVTFSGGGGANATATYATNSSGVITSVTVTNGGGLLPADYVGSVTGQTATGLQALRNGETTEFNILAVPGVTHNTVVQAALNLASARGDFLYLVDTPFGLTPQQVVDWHNGTSVVVANAPTGPINSSYAAIYWGWAKVTDTYNAVDVWLPPSGYVAAAMAFTDRSVGPWFTAAGPVRGGVNALALEYSPSQSERDLLCGIDTTNRINPLVQFATGINIWGNRTSQRNRSALESVHIRRMLLHAEKVCATAVRVLAFSPNDPITWKDFTMLVNDQLSVIKAGRGIEEFKVICDANTNPADQRQQKTMRGKMLIKPIEAAEIIMLDFSLSATGAVFSSNA